MNYIKKILQIFLIVNLVAESRSEVVKISSGVYHSNSIHQVQLLDVGAPALYVMLKIINDAENEIFITNYLINYWDYSTHYIFDALIKKRTANPNFKVKIILEDSTSAAGGYRSSNHWQWRNFIKKFLAKGIEFRIFNPRSFGPTNSNFRQHQKLIIGDYKNSNGNKDYQMIIGGRNFSDDYFGIVPHYNRLDKEIYVSGEIVKTAATEFIKQWSSNRVYNVLELNDSVELKKENEIVNSDSIYEKTSRNRNMISDSLEAIENVLTGGIDHLTLERIGWVLTGSENVTIIYSDRILNYLKQNSYKIKNSNLEITYEKFNELINNPPPKVNLVTEADFLKNLKIQYWLHSGENAYPISLVSNIILGFDQPSRFSKEENFIDFFYQTIENATKEVYFENQYFIPSSDGYKTLNSLIQKNVKINFLTNSLVSQDESNPGILTHDEIRKYKTKNKNLFFPYAFRGQNLTGIPGALWWEGTRSNPNNTWQIHAKAVVIDDSSAWIGSNNFDNRSEDFNPEMAIFIPNNREFALQVKKSILNNMNNSDYMDIEGDYWKSYDEKVKGKTKLKQIKSFGLEVILQATKLFW